MLTIDNLQSLFGLDTVTEQKTDTAKIDPFTIEKLPCELKGRLASFLTIRDLLNLAETSKSICSDLNLSISSSPLTDRVSQNQFCRSVVSRCFAVIIPNTEFTAHHSMTFTCKIENHGSCFAEVSIVEQELPLSQHPDFLRRRIHQYGTNGTDVRTSTRLKNSKLSLSFPINPNKFYQLYISTHGYELDDFVTCSNMTLLHIGFTSKNSSVGSYFKAYQFNVFEPPPIRWSAAVDRDIVWSK